MAKPTSPDLSQRLLQLLRAPKYQPLDEAGLARTLSLKGKERSALGGTLRQMEERGEVARVRRTHYVLPQEAELVTGEIQIHGGGTAHVLCKQPGVADLFISAEDTGTAMNGDTVVARIMHEGRHEARRGAGGARRRGRVIRILKRARDTVVGTLQRTKKFYYVIPDDPRFIHNIYVRPGEQPLPTPPEVGDKVVVRLDEWTSRHVNPEGEITEVLGAAGTPGVDMLSIIRKFGLPVAFPEAVAEEAARIPESVPPSELKQREDLRDALIYTIDPDDARDFDDAIQIERTREGGWRVGIHIADVSHYVAPGSALDKEAYQRGNSVYLADRVIPMLPERLSNGICSLKPRVERLTRTVFIDFTPEGRAKKARFSRSVIRSAARLTYKQAYAILTGQTPEPLPATVPDRTESIPPEVVENVKLAWELASLLRKNRFGKGSLDLDFPEVKVWLDAEGKPVRLEKIENDISHQLIEEYMLAANEAVARETRRHGYPSVYRAHEDPAPEKLNDFRDLVKLYGFRAGDLSQRAEVQKLLRAIRGSNEEYALKIAFLRSLKRAAYDIRPLGHYGLAKEDYTHFTSPIRRYADLVVHRVLGHIGERKQKIAAADLPAVVEHISVTERTADEAERESVKLKKLEYFLLAQQRGETFAAIVLDVRNYGLVVELPDCLISGLIHVSALSGDFYTFDPTRLRFTGRQSGKGYGIGDRLKVSVAKVDIYKQQIDFEPVEEGGKKPALRNGKPAPRKGPERKGPERGKEPRRGKEPTARKGAGLKEASRKRPEKKRRR